jgi:hypothetical protein
LKKIKVFGISLVLVIGLIVGGCSSQDNKDSSGNGKENKMDHSDMNH